ncbi:hypothetical protein Tco_0822861 [Tanacetum coccineum]|uniref:Uncharacterized protein n=1 Tax=Tanacetum coccineum TaxID=301880 RepID=A0ABQ5AJK0_9ASTR
MSNRFSNGSSDTSGTRDGDRSSRKSQKSLSCSNTSSHIRRFERLENRSKSKVNPEREEPRLGQEAPENGRKKETTPQKEFKKKRGAVYTASKGKIAQKLKHKKKGTSILEEQLLQIDKTQNREAIWAAIKNEHHKEEERVQQARLQTLKSEFEMLHMKEDETIDTFTAKLTTIVNKAASLGHTIEDSVVGQGKPFRERGHGRFNQTRGREQDKNYYQTKREERASLEEDTRDKSQKDTTKSQESAEIAESAEITESAKIAENAEKPQGVQKIPKELINEQGVLKEERTKNK